MLMEDRIEIAAQNKTYINYFIGVNILIFLSFVISGELNLDTLTKNFDKILGSALYTFLLGLLAVILNGIVSSELKPKLVFWKIKNSLPGSHAFTKHIADPRINPDALQSKHGILPIQPEEQNRLWYKIYKKNEKKIVN